MPAWFDERFPPLSIYYGGRDYLVLADPLFERLKEKEKAVKVIRTKLIEDSEHCDFYWAADAVEWLFEDLVGEFVLECGSADLATRLTHYVRLQTTSR